MYFLEKSPSAELIIDALDDNNVIFDVDGLFGNFGVSQNFHQEQYVLLNMKTMENASMILMTQVLGHELLHANMWQEIYDNTNLVEENGYDPETLDQNFPLVMDLWLQYGIETMSHEILAQNQREKLIDFMKEVDIAINGRAVNKGKYEYLSWIGLYDTPAYKNAVENGSVDPSEIYNLVENEKEAGRCD